MPKNPFTRGHRRELSKRHKIAVAGVATLGAAAVVFSAVPGNAETTTSEAAVSSAPVKYSSEQLKSRQADVSEQLAAKALQSKAAAEAKAAKAHAEAKAKAKAAAAAKKKAAHAAAAKKAAQARKAKEASRAAHRAKLKAATHKSYANNLDGWIKESLDIMKAKGIPGSYNGLHRNIIRESSGNPNAINGWDINAINGVPSIGLLQVIKPTFDAYHVAGTAKSQYNPVANITAAANYAADRYGSIDNVDSAY